MARLNADSYINTQSANINNVTGVHRDKYTQICYVNTNSAYALYNVPLPKTIQGKLILLCCDVGFKGFYDNRYKTTFLSYLEKFNMLELVDLLETYTRDQMYELMLRAQMNMTIRRNHKGILFIDTDSKNPYGSKWWCAKGGMKLDWFTEHLGYFVEVPDRPFELIERFKAQTIDYWELTPQIMVNAHSYAFINSNKIMFSLKEKENNHE